MLFVWEWLCPADTIDIARDFNYDKYIDNKHQFGDHSFKVDAKP